MDTNKYCVIMAGGIGSRFWPMSRNDRPKQFLDILGTGRTFIQSTFDRFRPIVPLENFLVVTNSAYRELVLEQLPELKPEQILGEPIGRNTAPAIAYAAFRIQATDPDSVMIVTPSDHVIFDNEKFRGVIKQSAEFAASNDVLMTIGIKPTHPNTGYGYIQVEEGCSGGQEGINKVRTFTEKPGLEMATAFVESGEFFWNSGIFIWKTEKILREMQEDLTEMYDLFDSIKAHYGKADEQQAIDRIYPDCRGISIDFGVMEKASDVYVYCSGFGWSDIGTWGSLFEFSPKEENANVVGADAQLYDVSNCIIKAPEGKLVVLEGLDSYIVVDTGDVLMICPKWGEQNIKRYIEDAKFRQKEKYI